jgi:arylsulfatase A-like enzyme
MRDIHDEAMAHQDEQIGRLVEHLKETGEWERAILVVASDHGHPAASYPRFGRGLVDPQPPAWEGALLGELNTHIPMVVFWPGRIPGGHRIGQPVSMIDLLPTLLELARLPPAEASQGRSLVPALLGDADWQPGPVVFDEFRIVSGSGELTGNLEILEGSWGASLEIAEADGRPSSMGRHPVPAGGRWASHEFPDVPRLLLYDLRADPLAHSHVNDDHPDRVRRAGRELRDLWEAHQALALRFEAGEEAALTPEQLESLRALGYIE